jgi:DNA-binding Lrp family transcriptional regulator
VFLNPLLNLMLEMILYVFVKLALECANHVRLEVWNIMKLTEKERKILSVLEFNADAPLSALQKKTGFREHTLRYHLQRFVETGLLSCRPVLNLHRCGFDEYEIFFLLSHSQQVARSDMSSRLAKVNGVIAVHEYVGDYDCSMTIAVRNARELARQFEDMSMQLGGLFLSKSISVRLKRSVFSRKYICGDASRKIVINSGESTPEVVLDQMDVKILSALATVPERSQRNTAHALGIPLSTLCFRVKRLERGGVIVGWQYCIAPAKLGVQTFKLLIAVQRYDRQLEKEMERFCEADNHIVECIQCLGSWDYECTVEVETPQQLGQLRSTLHERFKDQIASVRAISCLTESGRDYTGLFSLLQKAMVENLAGAAAKKYFSAA